MHNEKKMKYNMTRDAKYVDPEWEIDAKLKQSIRNEDMQ